MTKLLIIRHGDAGDADQFAAETGRSDDERPLTDKGKREMSRVAEGLRSSVEKIDIIASSPLVRARQTAEIVAAAYDMRVDPIADQLRPTTPLDEFVNWIAGLSDADVIAVVGHDPHLTPGDMARERRRRAGLGAEEGRRVSDQIRR